MKVFLRLIKYVKPYKKYLITSIFCTLLFAIFNGASVYLSVPLLDTLFQQSVIKKEVVEKKITEESQTVVPKKIVGTLDKYKERIENFILGGEESDVLLKICFLILLAFLGKNVFAYLQAYFLAYVEQGVIRDLRNHAYSHIHSLPMSFFKKERTGNIISRIMNDIYVVQTSVATVFLNFIREPLTIIVFLSIAISISWKMTLFSVVIVPISFSIIIWIGKKLRKQSTVLQMKMADITTIIHETISGIKIVKAFGMEKYENNRFAEETKKFFRHMLKLVRIRNASSPITEFLSIIVGALIIYYGGHLVLTEKTLRASEFMGFLLAIFQLLPPIKELSGLNNKIQESSAAGARVFEILDTETNIKNIDNPITITDFSNNIEFDDVSFHYDDSEELILKSISFKVEKGSIIALVGSSGAGKSTLVDLLPRFFDPTKGSIKIDGNDIKKFRIQNLRRMMGIVTQETILFNESIRSNIAYGLSDFPEDKLIKAAKAANAHNFIMEQPNGYETLIGERGAKLSGGQRQRISIARALLKNPPIMIFDEATSALDNESEALVQEAIERLMTDRTTFVIAHRLSTIRNASKIIVLDKGEIVQVGKHEELLKDETGLYNKLYQMQFRR